VKADSQRKVIERAAEVIQARYVDPAMGRKVADAIRREAKTDAFKHAGDPAAFAQALTLELRKLSGDGHFRINYSARVVPPPDAATADQYEEDDDSWAGPAVNHGSALVRATARRCRHAAIRHDVAGAVQGADHRFAQ
jgi:hypothetical protein